VTAVQPPRYCNAAGRIVLAAVSGRKLPTQPKLEASPFSATSIRSPSPVPAHVHWSSPAARHAASARRAISAEARSPNGVSPNAQSDKSS